MFPCFASALAGLLLLATMSGDTTNSALNGNDAISNTIASSRTLSSFSTAREIATADLRPVSWWQQRYDSNWVEQDAHYRALTSSTDSWDFYNGAYGLDGATAMFQATGDTKYLDQALDYAKNMVSSARVSSSLGSRAFHDSYLGWVSQRPDVA